ncbi:uncharacterized protein KY384_002969 [Bacidia gigantensis]|uniref:uncharacterized protein n=1 Tax=Bacidia gigantensis TaxID=2732470 RepID=UPI001D042807|nr:uncharacterized protein KY384_002969 [Bacidia gigantensis]KAG8531340.1 hypothetical protein KY384_002969 [Bacidia gigantensis]
MSLSNLTTVAPAWVKDPDGRGTWGLVQSCLVTLILCVYTAIHLNIRPNQTEKQSWIRRIRATLIAAVAPEYVFICALAQWKAAKSLQTRLNTIKQAIDHEAIKANSLKKYHCEACGAANDDEVPPEAQPGEADQQRPSTSYIHDSGGPAKLGSHDLELGRRKDNSEPSPKPNLASSDHTKPPTSKWKFWASRRRHHNDTTNHWTLRQAFFIVAGGYVVDSRSFWVEPYLTITPAGAVELASLGILPTIPVSVLDDKTKADPMTKILVCVQAGWFIIQCITRLAQDLPISLLEIHTLAHVLVAFCMYLLWFSKPYNALSPRICKETKVVETIALMCLSTETRFSPQGENRCALRHHISRKLVRLSQDKAAKSYYRRRGSTRKAQEAVALGETSRNTALSGRERVTLAQIWGTEGEGSRQPPHRSMSEGDLRTRRKQPNRCLSHSAAKTFGRELSPSRLERVEMHYALVSNALDRYKAKKQHLMWEGSSNFYGDSIKGVYFRNNYVLQELSDFSRYKGFNLDKEYGPNPESTQLHLTPTHQVSWHTILVFIFYSAFHLTAWNAEFPTTVERWLWRGSALVLLAIPVVTSFMIPLLIILILIQGPLEKFALKYYKKSWSDDGVAVITSLIPYTIYLAVAVAGRAYFLVESFVSLRKPVPGLYDTVEWTNFLPHG